MDAGLTELLVNAPETTSIGALFVAFFVDRRRKNLSALKSGGSSMFNRSLLISFYALTIAAAARADVVLQSQSRTYSVHALNSATSETFTQAGAFVRAASASDNDSLAGSLYQEDSIISSGLIRLYRQIGASGGFHGSSAEASAQFNCTFSAIEATPFDLSLHIWQNFNYQGFANAHNRFVFSSPTAGVILDSNGLTNFSTHISGVLSPGTYTISFSEDAGGAGTGSITSWADDFVLAVPAPACVPLFLLCVAPRRRRVAAASC